MLMLLILLVAAAIRLSHLSEPTPGLHYDEAANGILAADIGLRGERPVFIASYTGKDVFFFYLTGGLMGRIGDSFFALRLVSAFLGILTVAATYWLGAELFGDRRIALVAATLLAVSFWHVLFSRLGFRAISQPLLQALTVAALFRGLRRQSWMWVVLAGVGLGLTGYTYLAARIFPIILLLSLLPLIFSRSNARLRWQQLALFGAVGLIILLPLLVFFLNHPESFWVRVSQVGPRGDSFRALVNSYWRSLGMLFLVGDPYWRFNIPDRPLFNWFWGGLLVVGWLFTLLRWFRQTIDWQRSAYLLLAIAPMFMLLPTALATTEIVPSNLRAIGLIPFIFYLPALGLVLFVESLWLWVVRLLQRWPATAKNETLLQRFQKGAPTVIGGLVLLILVFGSVAVVDAYFNKWSSRQDVFYDTDSDLVAISQYLDNLDLDSETIFLAAPHYRHPTVAFLSDRYDHVKWLPQSQALVFPAEGPALYLFPRNSPLPEWAATYFPSGPYAVGPEGPDGEPLFMVYRRSSPAELKPPFPEMANFSDQLTLLGYDVQSGTAGNSLPLTMFWRVERQTDSGLVPFVHLEDVWGYRWSQLESAAYPAEQWQPGDLIVQRLELPLPDGLPPGPYRLRAGFFDSGTLNQLPLFDDYGRYAGNALRIDNIALAAGQPPDSLPDPPHTLSQSSIPGLQLLGYERAEEQATIGAPIWLALWWQATAPLAPMNSRLELVGSDNKGWILDDAQPANGTYPFEDWPSTQFVIDHHRPRIPTMVPPGDYRLKLRLMGAANDTLLVADLGSLAVSAADRNYSSPTLSYPLAASFGDEIVLLGYDLERVTADQHLLSLAWQAQSEPSSAYTVFVHVLHEDGTCCLWQQDLEPVQGTYPTSHWLNGEVVIDEYTIELPGDLAPGLYPLEVGLYLPETGHRLLVKLPGIRDNDALYLRPIEIQ